MSHDRLTWLPGAWTVHRFDPDTYREEPPIDPVFSAVIRTRNEVTVIDRRPPAGRSSGPWATLCVTGPIAHDVTGVMARLSNALAEAGIPVFTVSTYDTDYLMVPAPRAADTQAALERAGYRFESVP